MKKVGIFFLSLTPLLGAILAQIVFALILMILFFVYEIITAGGISDMNAIMDSVSEISFIAIILTGVLFPMLYFFIFGKKEIKAKKSMDIPKNKPSKIIIYTLVLLILGVLLQIALSIILTVILPLFPDTMEKYSALMDSIDTETVLSVISVTIAAPIAEECIFRGLTFKISNKIMPLIAANIFQALLFGVYHMNITQGIYAFMLGIILGFVYIKCESIFACIFLHMVVNSSSYLSAYILPDSLFENNIAIALILIVSVVCIAGILVLINKIGIGKMKEGNEIEREN